MRIRMKAKGSIRIIGGLLVWQLRGRGGGRECVCYFQRAGMLEEEQVLGQ